MNTLSQWHHCFLKKRKQQSKLWWFESCTLLSYITSGELCNSLEKWDGTYCGVILSGCFIRRTSHLVLVDKIRSWFSSWNQFHRVLRLHPLQDRAECHFGEWFVSLGVRPRSPAYCTYTLQFIIFALGKSLLVWKTGVGSHGSLGCHWCTWQQQSSFTRRSVDRRGNGSTAEVSVRSAAAINISGNNNQDCLFFTKLSISMSDLFWRGALFWQISAADSDCTLVTPCLPPALWWGWQDGYRRDITALSFNTTSCFLINICLCFVIYQSEEDIYRCIGRIYKKCKV